MFDDVSSLDEVPDIDNYTCYEDKNVCITENVIKFCSWNIYGLTQDKIDILSDIWNSCDFILLTECWTDINDSFTLKGYDFINFPRAHRHKNAKRNSGGMCVFIKSSIRKGVSINKQGEEILFWLILDKHFFGLKHNLYIGNIYLVPETSTHYRSDAFDVIEQHINDIDMSNDIIITGDLNAHTQIELDYVIEPPGKDCVQQDGTYDYIENFNYENISTITSLYEKGYLGRYSCDILPTNNNGKLLLNLCKSRGMLIMNGRIFKDKSKGECTWFNSKGKQSLVDYVLASARLFFQFRSFEIYPKVPESDHRPVIFSVNCNYDSESSIEYNTDGQDMQRLKKYQWQNSDLESILHTLTDDISLIYLNKFQDCMLELKSANDIGVHLNEYVCQAINRVCPAREISNKHKTRNGPSWFDRECRQLRSEALKLSERAVTNAERDTAMDVCKQYRAKKQLNKRTLRDRYTSSLRHALKNDKCRVWSTLDNMNNSNRHTNSEPHLIEFVHYFKQLDNPQQVNYFDKSYEEEAIKFINMYDENQYLNVGENSTELSVINANFTMLEIENAIDYLKNNKAPGVDIIPAEMIKYCKNILSSHIMNAFNYIIERREFPLSWCVGLKSSIHKAGKTKEVDNYRGITILPIFEKIFEIAVYKRLSFVNDAFMRVDENNGGFLPGRRTSDNLFIINGLIQRQILLGKSLVLCFVDFSKAFDLVNRDILFYKIMKSGWHGKVIDTLRNLYNKTSYKVKKDGWVSYLIKNVLGVNQGGVASGLLFRKYMADLDDYLNSKFGICIGEIIIVHLLWADDLILMAECVKGLQNLLNGLYAFCKKNLAIVNEVKTKCMVFGKIEKVEVYFNKQLIEQVQKYKYLGNIVKSIARINSCIFDSNTEYLCDKARKAIYAMANRTKCIKPVSPDIRMYMFNTLVQPILTFGSDVWGNQKSIIDKLDSVYFRFARCSLGVKGTTSKIITVGEYGMFPPSIFCKVALLNYYNRLQNMPETWIAKQVFNELRHLHELGFTNWITDALNTFSFYNLETTSDLKRFKYTSKKCVRDYYINTWISELNDIRKNPLLRTYNIFKHSFGQEKYISLVKEQKYRRAISKLRCSSHTLAIESGRYTRPKTPISGRLCFKCEVIEDEIHFVTCCVINHVERTKLKFKITKLYPEFSRMNEIQQFIYLLTNQNATVLTWFGKFLYLSFKMRSMLT